MINIALKKRNGLELYNAVFVISSCFYEEVSSKQLVQKFVDDGRLMVLLKDKIELNGKKYEWLQVKERPEKEHDYVSVRIPRTKDKTKRIPIQNISALTDRETFFRRHSVESERTFD